MVVYVQVKRIYWKAMRHFKNMFFWFSLNRDQQRINPRPKGRDGWGHFQSLPQKEEHQSPLSSFFYFPGCLLTCPHSQIKPKQMSPKQNSPSHYPDRIQSVVGLPLYLALECILLCNMSRNWTNKQLPTSWRKPIPSPSSLPALTSCGSNPVHQEQSFPCLL